MTEGEPVDYDKLEGYLRALAYSSRLELLHILRAPRPLGEIRLAPRRLTEGENPDRAISRQAMQAHLEKLLDIGVVVAREGGEPKVAKEYVANPQRLYQILEEFRRIATTGPEAPASREATVDLGAMAPDPMEAGPKLVLVHGLYDGRAYPLRSAELRGDRGWIIGRKPTLHVPLEYDPYVSLENSEIVREENEYRLLDLRSSKNGTSVNRRRLAKDERVSLSSGDIIVVGRSTLVFRRD